MSTENHTCLSVRHPDSAVVFLPTQKSVGLSLVFVRKLQFSVLFGFFCLTLKFSNIRVKTD